MIFFMCYINILFCSSYMGTHKQWVLFSSYHHIVSYKFHSRGLPVFDRFTMRLLIQGFYNDRNRDTNLSYTRLLIVFWLTQNIKAAPPCTCVVHNDIPNDILKFFFYSCLLVKQVRKMFPVSIFIYPMTKMSSVNYM